MNADHQPKVSILSTKGLSIVVTGIVLITALLKANSKDIPEIVKIIFDSSSFSLIGWVLAVVFLIGSVLSMVFMAISHDKEIDRLVSERNALQKILMEKNHE